MRRRDLYTSIDLRRELYDELAEQAIAESTTVPRLVDRRLRESRSVGERMRHLESDLAEIRAALLSNGARPRRDQMEGAV